MTHSQLVRDLIHLGLAVGDVIMVHSSMRAVGKVLGGPDVIIHALLSVGATGTVMMYVDWEEGVQALTRDDAPEKADMQLLEELPPFDPRTARACRAYGILPEFLLEWDKNLV